MKTSLLLFCRSPSERERERGKSEESMWILWNDILQCNAFFSNRIDKDIAKQKPGQHYEDQ